MPRSPKRPCRHPGCPRLSDGLYCEQHQKLQIRRESATERGYDARWRAARKIFLAENPLCVKCLAEKRVTPATVVDHKIPHRGDERLFWDRENWQALCKEHHDTKTGEGM